MSEKDEEWKQLHFAHYVVQYGDSTLLTDDIYSIPLDVLKEKFPDEWADFAVLEGV